MDVSSLDEAGCRFPTEHMGLREEKSESNDRSRTELGIVMNSSITCNQPKLNDHLGAGANAGSRADVMFVTTNSLSELVWSPNRGLSLKCADSSLTEKKTFLWGMESSNMMPSAPLSITVKEIDDERLTADKNLKYSQPLCHLDCQAFESATSTQSPRSCTVGHEQGPSAGMKEVINITEYGININPENDRLDKKLKGICSPTDTSNIRRNSVPNIVENDVTPVPCNRFAVDSSFIHLDKHRLDLTRLHSGCENFGEGASCNPVKGNRNVGTGDNPTASMDVILASEEIMIKQCILPATPTPIPTSPESKHEDFDSVVKEDGKNKLPTGYSNLPSLEKRESTSENGQEYQKGESDCVKPGIPFGSAVEIKQKPHQNKGIHPRGENASDEASLNNHSICLYQQKDEEKVLGNLEANTGILNGQDDSNGSAESCNSKGFCLAGKRPWISEEELGVGNKKMKKQTNENPHCLSVQGHDSSFMNWMLNMVKGLSKSAPDGAPSLNLVMTPQHEHGSGDQLLTVQGEKTQSRGTNMGFHTIFKALYCTETNAQDPENLNLDHQSREGSEKLRLAKRISDHGSIPLTNDEENDELYKGTEVSTKYHVISAHGDGPSNFQEIPYVNSRVAPEDYENTIAEKNNSSNIAFGLGNVVVSSSKFTFRNDLDSPSEGQEANKLNFVALNKSVNSMTKKSWAPESLWITRFSPKVSGIMTNSSQCNQNLGPFTEGSTENGVGFVKDQNVFEDCCEPLSENQASVAIRNIRDCVADNVGSFGSIRMMEHTDQKFKTKLKPIHPSQRFKTSEAMTSVFARRLDALRHIVPLEVSGSTTHVSTTCFFCGIRGHKLQDCSEVTESELEDLLKYINSYDGAEKLSCFCIRCFQLNHWASHCPNTSSRKQSHSDGGIPLLDLRSSAKVVQALGDDTLTNNAEGSAPDKSGCGCPVVLTVSEGKKPMVDTRVTTRANVSKKLSDMMILTESSVGLKVTHRDILENDPSGGKSLRNTSRDLVWNEKQSKPLSSTQKESNEIHISAFCNFVNRQIPSVPRETFETIKRLRLSRTDIIKWMNSSVSLFSLEGFYLRLRLSKWEEGLGGTGYYVARINGVLRERSSESSKVPLSLNIGGFKCLVEIRFVSNQDFLEDELVAWWCSTLKCGGQLPSVEDMKVKLEERKSFEF